MLSYYFWDIFISLTDRLHVGDRSGQGVGVHATDLVLADVELPDGLVLHDSPKHCLRLLFVRMVSGQQFESLHWPQPHCVQDVHVIHLKRLKSILISLLDPFFKKKLGPSSGPLQSPSSSRARETQQLSSIFCRQVSHLRDLWGLAMKRSSSTFPEEVVGLSKATQWSSWNYTYFSENMQILLDGST